MTRPEKKLIVGFDSAWTAGKSGAIAAVVLGTDQIDNLGVPTTANFDIALTQIRQWQHDHAVTQTLIFIDQPTIVVNERGQRPVEHLVCSAISKRKGGMQPASRSRTEMFGDSAPLWPFLRSLGGASGIEKATDRHGIIETYPALILAALGIEIHIEGTANRYRLPKYNPQNRKPFRLEEWQQVCDHIAQRLQIIGVSAVAEWVTMARDHARPNKAMQDQLDAAICLLAAVHHARGLSSLRIGDASGFIVVPHSVALEQELRQRCEKTGRSAADWIEVLG